MFYGGEALKPEESTNYSAGFSLEPLDNLTITADYFHIDVENRIGRSPQFALTPEDVAELVDRGVPGLLENVTLPSMRVRLLHHALHRLVVLDLEKGCSGTLVPGLSDWWVWHPY